MTHSVATLEYYGFPMLCILYFSDGKFKILNHSLYGLLDSSGFNLDILGHAYLRCIRARSALVALRNALYKCPTHLLTYFT